MADANPLGERGHALEEEYFRRRDRELIERLRAAAAADEAWRQMGTLTGLQDADVKELASLGFAPDTVLLLPLVPLMQVAWADSSVSPEEQKLIVEIARARGIAEGSAADAQLSRWLSAPPSPTVFAGASRLIGAMLDVSGRVGQGLTADDLVAQCEEVANASGGFLGIKKISAEERALLTKISQDLKKRTS